MHAILGFESKVLRFTQQEEGMKRFVESVKRFVKSEDGPTAVEYAVMLALIIVVCIAVITQVGQSASTTFSTVNGALS
jgi:pilus assembly protein Flp/PilA